MAEANRKSVDPDQNRISSLDYQIRNWARRYGVAEDRLREAVRARPASRQAAKSKSE